MKRRINHAAVRVDLRERLLTIEKIAYKHDCCVATVVNIARAANIKRDKGQRSRLDHEAIRNTLLTTKKSLTEVARQFKCSVNSVSTNARQLGLQYHRGRPKNSSSPDYQKAPHDEVVVLYRMGGWTYDALGKKYGVTRQAIEQVIKRKASMRILKKSNRGVSPYYHLHPESNENDITIWKHCFGFSPALESRYSIERIKCLLRIHGVDPLIEDNNE